MSAAQTIALATRRGTASKKSDTESDPMLTHILGSGLTGGKLGPKFARAGQVVVSSCFRNPRNRKPSP
jgi:hypothetical protein